MYVLRDFPRLFLPLKCQIVVLKCTNHNWYIVMMLGFVHLLVYIVCVEFSPKEQIIAWNQFLYRNHCPYVIKILHSYLHDTTSAWSSKRRIRCSNLEVSIPQLCIHFCYNFSHTYKINVQNISCRQFRISREIFKRLIALNESSAVKYYVHIANGLIFVADGFAFGL